MVTSKNYVAFIFVGLCAWRVVACSANTGNSGNGGPGSGGFPSGASGGGGASSGGRSVVGTGSAENGNGGALIIGQSGNAGMSNYRDMDSSCHPIKEKPEMETVTDSAIVTDTITTLTPVAIFIMQDRSSSTVTGTPPPASMDSWKNSMAAVTAFTEDPLSTGLDVGLGVFPPMSGGNGDCMAGTDCGMPVVPISALPANAPKIASAYQAATPTSFPLLYTPTECALRGMINTCLQFMSASPSGEKCVAVLVTDGTPTQCDQNETNLEAIIADGKTKGVETYTLGLPGSDQATLDAYAMAGGTTASIDVKGGPQAFVTALNGIRGKITHQDMHRVTMTKIIETPLRCQWKIPPQQANQPPLDPTKVNVLFTPPNQPGQQFGHVACAATCSATDPPATCPANGQAWYYDNEMTPTEVFLCPSTCNAIKNVQDATVDLQFHCPQKPFKIQ
jgi:hypothetical protein